MGKLGDADRSRNWENMRAAQRSAPQPELKPGHETAVLTQALLSDDSKAR